jgi:hypothetical protein
MIAAQATGDQMRAIRDRVRANVAEAVGKKLR